MQRSLAVRSGASGIRAAGATTRAAIALAITTIALLAASSHPCAAAPLFTAPSLQYPTGGGASSVAIGDMNGDGRADVVTGNEGSVSVLLGAGDGSFAGSIDFATGSAAQAVALVDLNADGILDLATQYSIWLGNGDGTLRPGPNLPVLGSTRYGDFDGDGRPDLVAVIDTTISVWPGRGDGTFAPPVVSPVGSGATLGPMSDLNGDQRLDLVLVAYDGFRVLLGDGDGSFTPGASYTVIGDGPESYWWMSGIAVGHLDGDGILDLAAGYGWQDPPEWPDASCSMFYGNGDGTFTSRGGAAWWGREMSGLSIADVNGDSRDDLLTGSAGTIHVLVNRGDGTFGSGRSGATDTKFAIGDLNGDTRVDLATVGGGNLVSVLIGNGDGTFGSSAALVVDLTYGHHPAAAASADLNGDGRLDLVTAGYSVDEREGDHYWAAVALLANDTGGFTFAGGHGFGSSRFGVALGDVNGDQRPDLAVTEPDECYVFLLLGDGSGGFGPRSVVLSNWCYMRVAIGDFNRDGRGDLVFFGSGVAVMLGNGDGTFAPPSSFESGTSFSSLVVEDLDQDSIPDLALANYAGAVSILLGDGGGGFSARTDFAVNHHPRELAAGDLNGDGRPDLLSTGDPGWVAVLLGRGDGTFTVSEALAEGVMPSVPAIGDMDGDGHGDLALPSGGAVAVMRGAGDGTFGPPDFFGTGDHKPSWVGIGDRNGDGRPDLTVTNEGLSGSQWRSSWAGSVTVLANAGPSPPPPPPPPAPIPLFTTYPTAGQPDSIVLGQTFSLTLRVRNDGHASDDGRVSVSFPAFTDPADGQWVSSSAVPGDLPGYVETGAGGTLTDAGCQPVAASYLVAEYVDSDWMPRGVETNTLTLTIQPRAVGTFEFYVRSTMHNAGGAACEVVSAVPVDGQAGFTDQQGWAVKRYTVTVAPPPTAPLPVFTRKMGQPYGPLPVSILLGESFSFGLVVRNDGAASDDGRIVVGFPSLAGAADSQFVSGAATGDAPGYREWPAGSLLADATCQPITASYLVAEYGDADWPWLGEETNTLNVTVRPPAAGTFYVDVRSTLHTAGGATCAWVNAVPAEGEAGVTDQQGWPVRRFAVEVLPRPPVPTFLGYVVMTPLTVTLGHPFTLSATVRNLGPGTSDGRISVSFPSFTAPSDSQWVSGAGGDDGPGYREFPAGASILRRDCSTVSASHLTVEYADDAWAGGSTEDNRLVLSVRPQAAGTFYIHVRSTMLWDGAAPCTYGNGIPANGSMGTDQQDWTVRVLAVQVVPPPPPRFVGSVTGIPGVITLGESVRITAVVRNDGPWSDDGRISFGFPNLTGVADSVAVAGGGSGGRPGFLMHLPGADLRTRDCGIVTSAHLVTEYADSSWAAGKTDTCSVVALPQVGGTFFVDVRATIRDASPDVGPCLYINGIPASLPTVVTDQQGWTVSRYAIRVDGPSGPLPTASVAWKRIAPTGAGPSARTGASAGYHPGRDALVIYGGADPVYRGDIWSLPLAEGSVWSPIVPGGPVPLRRIMQSMIYNPVDDQLVLFGGLYDFFLNDLVVMPLTGVPWWFSNPGHGTPPIARGGHAAVYDPVRHRMLVIGGYGQALMNDVWEYAPPGAGTWRQLAVAGSPMPGRVQHTAVYDPVRDRVIVIGGDAGVFRNDVWALNLSGEPTWEELTPAGAPPSGRREHVAIYDPQGDRVIVYGGFDGRRRGDLWSLDLAGEPTWSILTSTTVPPTGRFGHAAVYDAARRRMVMFGGDYGTGQLSSDVWALELAVPTPVTLALAGTEVTSDRVRLTWAGGEVAGLRAVVYRASGEGRDWVEVGSPTVEGGDRLVYEDRAVIAGTRYGYQLRVWAGSEERQLDPVWVTVPRPAVLSLAGAYPNPAQQELSVVFSLPDDRAASLEVFDLRGRRVAGREVGSLGAGEHRLSLADARGLPAGIYLVRLSRDGRALTAKACVVR